MLIFISLSFILDSFGAGMHNSSSKKLLIFRKLKLKLFVAFRKTLYFRPPSCPAAHSVLFAPPFTKQLHI